MSRRKQLDLFSVSMSQPDALPHGARWRVVDTPLQPMGFVLIRSQRRSIGLTVDDTGLRVRAPRWATLAQIDAAVIERSAWIMAKLRDRRSALDRQARMAGQWRQNGRIPYMGVAIALHLDAHHEQPHFTGCLKAPRTGDVLALPLAPDAAPQRITDATHAWLQQQAGHWFDLRLRHFVERSGRPLAGWRLSSARTRWGSCSSAGRILLNWRLIHFRHALVDYVIAHEVAHLREMNHSPAFWRELERLYPGFAAPHAELRRYRPGMWPAIRELEAVPSGAVRAGSTSASGDPHPEGEF